MMNQSFSTKNLPLLVVVALSFESAVFRNILIPLKVRRKGPRWRYFQHPERPVHLLEIGIGGQMPDTQLKALLHRIRPRLVLNYGICGALDDTHLWGRTYRITHVASIVDSEGSRPISLPDSVPLPFPPATLLTVPQPVTTRETKNRHRRATGAHLVDMEAFRIARITLAADFPLIVVKTVSDYADETTADYLENRRDHLRRSMEAAVNELLSSLLVQA